MQNQTQVIENNNAVNVINKQASIKVPDFCVSRLFAAPLAQSTAIKPSDKEKKNAAVEKLIIEGAELSKLHERYNEEYIVRGNKALYEVLASIYAYALTVDESSLKEKILERMKAELKEVNIKTTTKTPWLTTVVKFIVKVDRQTAANYSRVLQVAFDEDLAAEDLAAYIERRGGVAQIRETEAVATAKGKGSELTKERIILMRELLLASVFRPRGSFKFDGNIDLWPTKAGGVAESEDIEKSGSTFHHFIAVEGNRGEFHVVAANNFSQSFEDVIMRHMSVRLTENMEELRDGVKQFQAAKCKWQDDRHSAIEAQKQLENKTDAPM